MSSAGWYRQTRDWDAGDTSPRRFDLGPNPGNNPEAPGALGLLRVSYATSGLVGLLRADVRIGDDGTILEGIDLPFCLVIEVPANVTITPRAALPSRVSVNCIVSPALGEVKRYALRTEVAIQNAVIELPQWVRAVTPLAPATFHYRTSGAVALGAASAIRQLRPTLAADIVADAAGTLLLEY